MLAKLNHLEAVENIMNIYSHVITICPLAPTNIKKFKLKLKLKLKSVDFKEIERYYVCT